MSSTPTTNHHPSRMTNSTPTSPNPDLLAPPHHHAHPAAKMTYPSLHTQDKALSAPATRAVSPAAIKNARIPSQLSPTATSFSALSPTAPTFSMLDPTAPVWTPAPVSPLLHGSSTPFYPAYCACDHGYVHSEYDVCVYQKGWLAPVVFDEVYGAPEEYGRGADAGYEGVNGAGGGFEMVGKKEVFKGKPKKKGGRKVKKGVFKGMDKGWGSEGVGGGW